MQVTGELFLRGKVSAPVPLCSTVWRTFTLFKGEESLDVEMIGTAASYDLAFCLSFNRAADCLKS